ncbi:MAG: hypothetical protein LBV74_05560, partial [Tannerella sp.]|nr:hypothetical protein [Tannerella sp.]
AYEETLTFRDGDVMRYHLPLGFAKRIPEFSLCTKVYRATQKPKFVEQPDGSLSFSGDNQTYEVSLRKTDYIPEKSLVIDLPKNTNVPEVVLQENRDGSYYFLINVYPKGQSVEKVWSNRIGIIWDNSLSGLYRDKEKELELLDKIIRRKQNLTVDLGLLNISFAKAGSFHIKDGDWSELKTYLQRLTYDGATDFCRLNEKTLSCDEYLFFTEGLSTFGDSRIVINKPVYTISSSPKADYGVLKSVSARTGGKFVNLMSMSVNDAYQLLGHDNLQFLGIKEVSDVSEVYPSVPTDVNGHISVAGITQNGSGELTLLFGRKGKTEMTQKVQLKHTPNEIRVNRFWAQKKIAEMDVLYEQNKEDIELLGRQFGIVTRNMSLIVLENLSDYVMYEITPPAELLSAYNEQIKNRRFERDYRVNNLLDRAINVTEELKVWWNTEFKIEKKFPTPMDEDILVSAQADVTHAEIISIVEDDAMAEVAYFLSSDDDASMAQAREYEAEERTQSSAASRKTANEQVAKIRIPTIRSDKEYMQQISSAEDAYAAYLSLRETYMDTPGFYFDISDFFYENNRKDKGLLILSSLADLSQENAELFKTLAYKLKEKGEYAYELFITGKVREWRPMDPQSHRDYALALQDNGQYQEALDCLYSILNASYTPELAARDYGIEEILVCEINNLITLHRKKLDLSKIDSRLIADLPVQVRVVINWNKNDTDIDLWVTDPNGEKCMYSHKRTAIGGRLSNDFRGGYGPEQFLLKKAINGTYKIETNFFGERQLTLSGPTTIMGEIYLYYSDGREERQVITFQNGEKGREKEGVLIGEFIFSNKKQPGKTQQEEHRLQKVQKTTPI